MANQLKFDVIIFMKLIFSFIIYNNILQNHHKLIVESSRADLGTYLHITPSIDDSKQQQQQQQQQQQEELYVLAFINYTYISDGKEIFYPEEKARYGEGKILNVKGYLEHITSYDDLLDHTACSPQILGTNGKSLTNNLKKPWIALIRRGKCTFEEKIKHAWKYGASGVIVYNEIPAVSLEKMKVIEKDRNITAIFTYKWIGEQLGRIVDEGNVIWVSISEGQRGFRQQHNINKTSVLFVSISFIVLMIISLVWLIFYYIQRFRYLQSKDQHSRHLCAVAKRVIMKIPTKSGKNEDNDNDCCAICIEPYKATDCIRVLPCKHEFHKNCIDPWLLEHRTCPMCKLDVLKHYGFVCTLHNHCPAQANRVFWDVFPNRYIGSEESILQLDLDMEIGDHGLNSGDDDRFSIDNPRISHTVAPTFHIQTFNDHSHLVRDISLDSTSIIHHNHQLHPNYGQTIFDDNIPPERSQSSLSCINHMLLNENITNKLFSSNNSQQQQHQNRNQTNVKDLKTKTHTSTTTGTNFLAPNNKMDKESISLPGTLKKKRSSSDSCRGSNNCYVKVTTTDLKQLAAKIEKGCPKSRTTVIIRQASDDEHLLNNTDSTETVIDSDIPLPAKPSSSSSSDMKKTFVKYNKDKSSLLNEIKEKLNETSTSNIPSTSKSTGLKITPPQIRIETNSSDDIKTNNDDDDDDDNNDNKKIQKP